LRQRSKAMGFLLGFANLLSGGAILQQSDRLKMRCPVVADRPYSLPQFDWLLSSAPEFDLVIIAGDALDVASAVISGPRSW
jgi:hypothetical protein